MALNEIKARRGEHGSVAEAYGNDSEVRKALIKFMNPLPQKLRGLIAGQLRIGNADSSYLEQILELFDHEEDASVKLQMAVGYYRLLKELGKVTKDKINYLKKLAICIGPDFDERRQAAMAAYISLDLTESYLQIIKSQAKKKEKVITGFFDYKATQNPFFLRFLLKNYTAFKKIISTVSTERSFEDKHSFIDAITQFADEFPEVKEDVLKSLTKTQLNPTTNILAFLERVQPRSPLLLQYCLNALKLHLEHLDTSEKDAVFAAELIGSNFAQDKEVYDLLIKKNEKRFFENAILCLCEGWPASEIVRQAYEAAEKKTWTPSLQVHIRLIALLAPIDRVLKVLEQCVDDPKYFHHSDFIATPIIRRLKKDQSLSGKLEEVLKQDISTSQKISYSQLLSYSYGLTPELKTWCESELGNSKDHLATIGFDITTGEVRTLNSALLEMLVE
jgi:hypothetical protein